jgi:hypothetical protein
MAGQNTSISTRPAHSAASRIMPSALRPKRCLDLVCDVPRLVDREKRVPTGDLHEGAS